MAVPLIQFTGMGSKASTVPIYSAENCPAAIRGGQCTLFSLVMSLEEYTNARTSI